MATQIGTGVRLYGYNLENWIFTFHASDDIKTAWENWRKGAAGSYNPVGRAVESDFGTKAGQVKLAADNATVFGRIESVEIREQEGIQVVAVALKFLQKMPKSAAAIGVGVSVQGAGEGLVKSAAADVNNMIVPEAANAAASEVIVIKQ